MENMVLHADQQVIFFHGGQWFEGKILEELSPSKYRVVEFAEILQLLGKTYTISADQIMPLPNQSMHRMESTSNNKEGSLTSPGSTEEQLVLASSIKLSETQVQNLIQIIPQRRMHAGPNDCNETNTTSTAIQLVSSLLPKECDLRKLGSQAHQKDASALLQLADAYRFGLLGVVSDRYRASTLYACAAWGVNELDFEDDEQPRTLRFAYPMGTPEAMCAYAIDIGEHEGVLGPATTSMNHSNTMSLAQAMQIVHHPSNQRLQASLATMTFFVAHSVRRGWISPLALEFGQTLHCNRQAVKLFLPNSLYILKILNNPDESCR